MHYIKGYVTNHASVRHLILRLYDTGSNTDVIIGFGCVSWFHTCGYIPWNPFTLTSSRRFALLSNL